MTELSEHGKPASGRGKVLTYSWHRQQAELLYVGRTVEGAPPAHGSIAMMQDAQYFFPG